MINKIKQALGIENVKIAITAEPILHGKEGYLEGVLEASTLSDNLIQEVQFRIIERYERGRKDERRIDEYIIGSMTLKGPIHITKDEVTRIKFFVPYEIQVSEMDKMEKNLLLKPLIMAAKKIKSVKSQFRIEAEARVAGVSLHPFYKLPLTLQEK